MTGKEFKIKKGFLKEIEAEEKVKKEQEDLRKKYEIEDENKVVVEKKTTYKFTVNLLIRLLKIFITVVVFILATIGLLGLIYPAPRQELLVVFEEIQKQLSGFIPGL